MITYFLKLLGKYGDNFVFFTNKKILGSFEIWEGHFYTYPSIQYKIEKVVSSAKPGW